MSQRIFQHGLSTIEVVVMIAAVTLLSVLGYATLQHMQKPAAQPHTTTQTPLNQPDPASIDAPLPTMPNAISTTSDLETAMQTIEQIDPATTVPAQDEISLEQLENAL